MAVVDIFFYIFAILALGSAYFVVTSKNIIYAAFNLIVTLFAIAGFYILLGADFIAIVQIVVYVGGIMILLLFGVMLTNKITDVTIKTGTLQVLPASIVIGMFAGVLLSILMNTHWRNNPATMSSTTVFNLGKMLLNEYIFVFELLGIILLMALIGAASIARKNN